MQLVVVRGCTQWADMAAVGELVLVLGLLVSAHCEVRARDPEVVEEEEELGGRGGGGGAHLQRLHPGATETPPLGERGNYPARTGNWCAFVQKRVVTVAMACGTEKYTIKSQSPCPSGTADCQLVMYKLATRPVYRQKQRIFTVLLWRCCPGHGGDNCDDAASDAQLDSGGSALIGRSEAAAELHSAGVQLHRGDPNREQNDRQASIGAPHESGYPDNQHDTHPGPAHNPHHTPHHAHNTYNHPHPHHPLQHQDLWQQERRLPVTDEEDVHPEAPAALPVPHMMALVMSQLQPVLLGFNRSLEHLSRQVGDLARDVAQLKSSRPGAEPPAGPPDGPELHAGPSDGPELHAGPSDGPEQHAGPPDGPELHTGPPDGPELHAGPPDGPELDEATEERLDAKLEEVFQKLREVQGQVESRLHSQHAMLHYNLTSFKMDIDMKLKRQQKMLQVSLQAMDSTLAELKLDQDRDRDLDQDQDQDQDQDRDQDRDQTRPTDDQLQDQLPPPSLPPPHPPQRSDTEALWEAIEHLDKVVVNNVVKVRGLVEDAEVTSGDVQQLRRDLRELGKQINQTARTSQIQFMETGLEVEAAREVVLRRVGELAGNLSQQSQRLQEMDVDVDYLYTSHYKHNASGDCDCKGLKAAVARLERGVANVTELANENRLALHESGEGGAGQWGGASDWEPAVEALQQGLQQVREALRSEQTRTRTLDRSLSQLSSSVTEALAEVSGLKEDGRKLTEDGRQLTEDGRKLTQEMQHLSGSFNSLLKDAIRHSDVLELLLGEEVLEFLEWPVQDQEAHSIPTLKEQLRHLQEQLRGHDLSISSLLGSRPVNEGREEVPSADQPSSHLLPDDWPPTGSSRGGAPARERQLLLHPSGRRPEHGGDGSDLWKLEKTVEELELKVLRLEEKPCNASTERAAPPGGVEDKLQAEVAWLKRGLEEHLRVFKNVFSNADVLVASDATLELDKLWQLVKKRGGRGGNHRSRRSSGVVPVLSSLSEGSLLLVAGSPLSVSSGVIVFEALQNPGQFYSDAGTFTAPVNGVYLFVLTLDLKPGPAHAVLRRRGSGGALVPLHRQEVTEAGPVTGVGLLLLSGGEEVRLELKGGVWAESEDNVFTVLLLRRTT